MCFIGFWDVSHISSSLVLIWVYLRQYDMHWRMIKSQLGFRPLTVMQHLSNLRWTLEILYRMFGHQGKLFYNLQLDGAWLTFLSLRITFLVVSIDPKRLNQNQGVTIGEVLQGIRSDKTLELFRTNSPLFKIEAGNEFYEYIISIFCESLTKSIAEDLFLGMLETNKEYRFSAREAYNHPVS